MTAIGVDPVRIPVENRDTLDLHVIGSKQTDAVIWRILNRDVLDNYMRAALQSDRLGTAPLFAITVDRAGSRDGDPLCVFGPDQRVMKKAGFSVGGVLEVQPL